MYMYINIYFVAIILQSTE